MANYRNSHLLRMAQGKPCLLRIPGVCNGDWSTTVACHSNEQKHGKGRSIKAHDYWAVCGCSSCHHWLDQGPASRDEKRQAFEAAHSRQVQAWLALYLDTLAAPRDRATVMHALKAMEEA